MAVGQNRWDAILGYAPPIFYFSGGKGVVGFWSPFQASRIFWTMRGWGWGWGGVPMKGFGFPILRHSGWRGAGHGAGGYLGGVLFLRQTQLSF